MGSACCVAARDRTISNGATSENLHRNLRYSPSWSFRWDNRRRVAGEETSMNWSSDGASVNDRLEFKSGTTAETGCPSVDGSPLDSFRSFAWQKSPTSEINMGRSVQPSSDILVGRNSTEVRETLETPAVSFPSPRKLSQSAQSVSSLSMSPLSSHSQVPLANFTPSRMPHHSPGLSNESTRGSFGGSSDAWSIPSFPEFLARGRLSFDSENFGFNRDKGIVRAPNSSKASRSCRRSSHSHSLDLRTCGICANLLTETSSWGTQKFFIACNELAVVSVLTCGHVFHADCLENMTSETNKYDPPCPVCTFGEKHAFKMFEKSLKAEMDLKGRRKGKNKVVDSHFSGNLSVLDHQKSSGREGRYTKLSSSSSLRNYSSGKAAFLRRHFSFGSKDDTRALTESVSTRKRIPFWAKSSRE